MAAALQLIEGGRPARPQKLKNPPTEREMQKVLASARDLLRPRQDVAREQRRLFNGDYAIPRPPGLSHWNPVTSTIPAQQAGLIKGVVLGTDRDGRTPMPTVEAYVASIGKSKQSDAQEAENALNNLFPRLEEQNGPLQQVWEPVINDQILVGWGVTRLQPLPARVSKGLPELDYADPRGYLSRRAQAVKGQGGFLGRLPLHFEHVLAERALWFSDEDGGGISMMLELKTRRLSDLLRADSPYHNAQLHEFYAGLKESERELASSVLVDFWCIETDEYQAWMVDGSTTQLAAGTSGDHLYVSRSFTEQSKEGKLVGVQRNPLGRSSYVVYPGLSMGSEDPATRFYGVNWLSRNLVRVLSQWYSIRLSRAAQFAAPPWVGSQQQIDTGGGQMGYAAQGPDGEERQITLEPGKLTWLPPGTSIQEMISANHDPAEVSILQELLHETQMLGISESILDAGGGQSGYLNSQVVNTVLSRFRPLIQNIRLAWKDQVGIALDCLRYLGEPLSVLVGTKERSAEWYTLDPDMLDGMELHLKVKFGLNVPQDQAANIQNAIAVTQAQLLSRETAMADFLGVQDVEREKELITLDDLERDPAVQQTIRADVMRAAGIEIQDQQAQQQGDVSAEDIASLPPAGQQAFTEAARPGVPGWQAAQQVQQQPQGQQGGQVPTPAGNGPTPIRPPAGTPHTPPRPTTPGPVRGRAAGQRSRPGGPRRSGGI